jgi:hypothetical protein
MPVGEHQDTEGEPSWAELGHEELAESIIAEVLSAPKGAASKPYVAALCKVCPPFRQVSQNLPSSAHTVVITFSFTVGVSTE